MRVTKPLPLTLVSTNIADSSAAEWVSGTSYATGAKVKVTTGVWPYHEYESLADANAGNAPAVTPSKWLDLGPINRHSMFDDRAGTVTTHASSIAVAVNPGAVFDTIALVNLSGVSSVTVTVKRGAATVFTQTGAVIQDFADWESFFFSELVYTSHFFLRREVFYPDATVYITMTGSNVSCGHCMIGRSLLIGDAQYGISTPAEDYSTKETDGFGYTYLMKRPNSKGLSGEIEFPTAQYDRINRILANLLAVPALWDANPDGTSRYFESLLVWGFLDSYNPSVNYESTSFCSLEVEGLI